MGDIRIVTICLIGFADFLGYNELAALKESDLHIFSDHMNIFIEWNGAWVFSYVSQNLPSING